MDDETLVLGLAFRYIRATRAARSVTFVLAWEGGEGGCDVWCEGEGAEHVYLVVVSFVGLVVLGSGVLVVDVVSGTMISRV